MSRWWPLLRVLSLIAVVAALAIAAPDPGRAAESALQPAPLFTAAHETQASPLRMVSMTAPVFVGEVPPGDEETRLQRLSIYRSMGIAVAAGAAFGIGAATGGPTVGLAAGSAVLISFLLLP